VRSLVPLSTFRGVDAQKAIDTPDYNVTRNQVSLVKGGNNLLVWTAVSPTQLAEEASGKNGVFTAVFANGLFGRKADLDSSGKITPAELLHYTRSEIEKYCGARHAAGNPCKTGMTPTLEPLAETKSIDLLSWGSKKNGAAPEQPAATNDLIPANNRMKIKVELLGGRRVGGTPLRVRVTSPQDGYLIVLDRRKNGEVRQLFPSVCARTSRQIRADAPLTLPDATFGCEFVPDKPGSGHIIVIVTEDNVPLDQLLKVHRDLEAIPAGDAYLAEITGKLMKVWTGDERNRPVRWGVAVANYVID
jgi:hypothetical protein